MKSKSYFSPRFAPGKWAVGVLLVSLVLTIFLFIFAEVLDVIPDGNVEFLGIITIILAILPLFLGILDTLKNKERSVLVLISMIIGLLVLSTLVLAMIMDFSYRIPKL